MRGELKKAPRVRGKYIGENQSKLKINLLYKNDIVKYFKPDWSAVIRGMDEYRRCV